MSNQNMFIRIGLTGADRVTAGLRQITNSGSQYAQKLGHSWTDCGKRISDAGSLIRKTALLIGGGALLRQAMLDVIEFERGLMEVKLTGGLTAKEMQELRQQLMNLSSETLQLPEEQLAAFKDMVAAGIDPRQAIKGMRAINRTATATFSNVRDIGASTIDLLQKMQIDPTKLERAFNIMSQGGKEGKFELKDMARFFPEVTSDAAKFGMTGEKGVAQLVAMLQIARKGTAVPAEAANNMRNFFAQIIQYREEFGKLGINVFEFVDVKTGKFKKGFDVFFEEIIKKSKGSPAMLQLAGIRDRQSMDFIVQMMQNWEEYIKIRDKALSSADADIVDKDFNEVLNTSYGKLQKLKIGQSKAMKSGGSSWFAQTTTSIGNWATENPLLAAGGAIGGYLGYKMLKGYIGKKLGGGLGGVISGALDVQKVFVTNLPGSETVSGGATDVLLGKKIPPTILSRMGGALTSGAAIAGGKIALAGAAGYGIGTGLNKLIGMAVGVNKATDKWYEGGIGGYLGDKLYDLLHPEEARLLNKNTINMNIRIDEKNRVYTETDNMDTDINLDRGILN